jgi:thioester reductase-like protein
MTPLDEIERLTAGEVRSMLLAEKQSLGDRDAKRIAALSGGQRELLLLQLARPKAGASRQPGTGSSKRRVSLDLNAEAVLDPTIRPAAASVDLSRAPAAILLTGATGYFGGYLLRDLLSGTDADLYCLVRARSLEEASKRLEQKLDSATLQAPRLKSRIIPVIGDLGQPMLGISEDQYRMLARRVEAVYHSGAVVNFVSSYRSLKPAAVLGTQEVLRFATHLITKPVHHISSISVFTMPHYREADIVMEDDSLDHWEGLAVGYAQSKWVSEKMVMIARAREVPVCIYRPGMITGDSQSGFCKLDDFMPRMIRGCTQLGVAPDMEGFAMDLVPVDYAARATVHLSLEARSLGKAFNVLNPPPIGWNRIVERMNAFGCAITTMPYDRWLEALRNAPGDNSLVYLLPVLDRLSQELFTWPRLDCRNTREGLAGTSICSPPAEELLDTYLSYFVRSGFLPDPKEQLRGVKSTAM